MGDLIARGLVKKNTAQLAETAKKYKNKDLSYLLQQHGKVIVDTGDSLSFNSYGFGTESTEASLCDVGILSWSFLVRDAIHRNDSWFIDAEKIMYRFLKDDTQIYYNNADLYKTPFNGKVLNVAPKQNSEEIIITFKHANPTNKSILYMTHNPLNTCCSFDIYVDGVFKKTVNTNGTGKNNKGYELLPIELDVIGNNANHEIKLTNFIQTASTPATSGILMQIFMSGIGTKYTPIYLTGYGGKTSTWLLDNISSRVLQYNPDLVMITIGANDPWSSISPETTESNVRNICTQIRNQNPNCEIVLMTTTSQRDPNNPNITQGLYGADSLIKPYILALSKIALEFNTYFIDLMELFEHIPVTTYRFDNVHLSHFGNTFLARNVLNTIMPESLHDKNKVDSDLVLANSIIENMTPLEGMCFAQGLNAETGDIGILFQSPNNPVLKVSKINDNTIRVYTRYATTWYNTGITKHVSVSQYSNDVLNLLFRQIAYKPNYIDYRVIKVSDGSLTASADWTNNPSAFYLQIKF